MAEKAEKKVEKTIGVTPFSRSIARSICILPLLSGTLIAADLLIKKLEMPSIFLFALLISDYVSRKKAAGSEAVFPIAIQTLSAVGVGVFSILVDDWQPLMALIAVVLSMSPSFIRLDNCHNRVDFVLWGILLILQMSMIGICGVYSQAGQVIWDTGVLGLILHVT